MSAVKSSGDLTLVNHQQQNLLHTIVDPETYTLKVVGRGQYRLESWGFKIITQEEDGKQVKKVSEKQIRESQLNRHRKQERSTWLT